MHVSRATIVCYFWSHADSDRRISVAFCFKTLCQQMPCLVLLLPSRDLLHLAQTSMEATSLACSQMYCLTSPFHICLCCKTLENIDFPRCNLCYRPMCQLNHGMPGSERPRLHTTIFEAEFTSHQIIWNTVRVPWRPHRLALVLRFWWQIEDIWGTQGHLLHVHFVPAIMITLLDNPSSLNPLGQPDALVGA